MYQIDHWIRIYRQNGKFIIYEYINDKNFHVIMMHYHIYIYIYIYIYVYI
jgi:hypothetical protein